MAQLQSGSTFWFKPVGLFLVVLLESFSLGTGASPSCYSQDTDPYRYYSTWTAYEEARGTDVKEETLPGCTPIQFYMLARHGFRYTDAEYITKITERLPQLWNSTKTQNNSSWFMTCQDDVNNLDSWKPRMKVEDEWIVVQSGRDELRGAGERFKQRYPRLLGQAYDPNIFEFRHTKSDTDRTQDSAEAFVEGLFSSAVAVEIEESADPDWLLKFYSLCKKYTETILQTKVYYKERDEFVAGDVMKRVLDDVSERLGVTVDYETLVLIYESCRVEYGVYGDSPWCAALVRPALEALEYKEDLHFYYKNGYGYDINYKQSCPLVKDVLEHFSQALSNSTNATSKQVITRFGHMPDMNSFYARLGLFKDDIKPTAANYDSTSPKTRNRKWRTSLHTAMGSNIVFVLYQCDNGDHQVKAFESERPITIPGCQEGSFTCSYEKVRSLWQPYANECDMDKICKKDSSAASRISASVDIVWVVMISGFMMRNSLS